MPKKAFTRRPWPPVRIVFCLSPACARHVTVPCPRPLQVFGPSQREIFFLTTNGYYNGTIHFHYVRLRAEYALQRPHSPTHTHAMQPKVLSAGSLTSAHPFRCALPCGQVLSAVHLRDDGLLAARVANERSEGSQLLRSARDL